jgi:hypothetical protein
MGEDSNFTFGELEVSALTSQLDPLSEYFIRKLEESGLLDI